MTTPQRSDEPQIDISKVDISTLYHREHEVIEKVRWVSPEWQECQHGKTYAEVLAYWSDDAPWKTTTGRANSTQKFTTTRHLDGTAEFTKYGDRKTIQTCYGQHYQCPQCKSIDTLSTKQEAWLDRTTCSKCEYEHIYMIGD